MLGGDYEYRNVWYVHIIGDQLELKTARHQAILRLLMEKQA